jgi:hypothetical protein
MQYVAIAALVLLVVAFVAYILSWLNPKTPDWPILGRDEWEDEDKAA